MQSELAENQMVYCNLVEYDNRKVIYDFGGDINDITGRFTFDYVNSELEINKEPDIEMAPIRHIHRMLRMNQTGFNKGVFKEKMSYECG